jgi:hypothetical protein
MKLREQTFVSTHCEGGVRAEDPSKVLLLIDPRCTHSCHPGIKWLCPPPVAAADRAHPLSHLALLLAQRPRSGRLPQVLRNAAPVPALCPRHGGRLQGPPPALVALRIQASRLHLLELGGQVTVAQEHRAAWSPVLCVLMAPLQHQDVDEIGRVVRREAFGRHACKCREGQTGQGTSCRECRAWMYRRKSRLKSLPTHYASRAREAEIGVVEGEIVARPLGILLRALGGRNVWREDEGGWVGAVGRLEDHPELAAQLDQGGTRQERRPFGSIVLRKARGGGGKSIREA